jgi:hypothetical protein
MQLNEAPFDQPKGQIVATHSTEENEDNGLLQRRNFTGTGVKISTGNMTTNEQDSMDTETDISAGQKMLSAVSGSLLTSLLGERPFLVLCSYLANLCA